MDGVTMWETLPESYIKGFNTNKISRFLNEFFEIIKMLQHVKTLLNLRTSNLELIQTHASLGVSKIFGFRMF